ncbi:VWA domain-containing protein [Iamia majanohamensis]|uniref:VWA domain-containing protein n=1 Tax=Iamia majanohamensis TaxID=467976 RepID=A0AAF0BV13_9ACTN|nr:VWA domain-containing protein [Iamia majanohamensis]WCO68377.1 VWA domain-containing protein [Iamia majanohamensis]
MTLAITYLSPGKLWLLALVAALGVVYVVLQTRRRTYAVRFTNLDLLQSVAPRSPGWRRHIPAIVVLLALSSMVVALARPAREERVPLERATVILAIDTSLSMMAEDVPPNRLEAAQAAAKTFLDDIPEKINVGLVGFNGSGTILVPPTTDRARVRTAIDGLELDERTAIGEAIFAALQAVKQAPPAEDDLENEEVPASIVLMSDGKTTVGRPDSVGANAAREEGVPVNTIAFGTDDGVIVLPSEPAPIPVDVDREALERIAEATDGKAFAAASEGELREVYRNIGSSVGFDIEFREIGLWFVGLGLALVLLSSTLSLLWFSRLP